MVIISDAVKATLRVALQSNGVGQGEALRLSPGMEGFTLKVDSPSQSDRIIYYNGAPVFIIDQALDNEIKHVIIDVGDGLQGPEVIIRPFPGIPNGNCLSFGENDW